jgi:hypothetical protein
MKRGIFALFAAAACGSAAPPSGLDASGTGGTGGAGGAMYSDCPQHRVEGPECTSPTGGVLRKDGLICASCSGVDASGTPTPKPVGCKTVAGGDLCVADCAECS